MYSNSNLRVFFTRTKTNTATNEICKVHLVSKGALNLFNIVYFTIFHHPSISPFGRCLWMIEVFRRKQSFRRKTLHNTNVAKK
jgi:hypothetical protein